MADLRFPRTPGNLLALWQSMDDPFRRSEFLKTAIDRKRLDVLLMVGANPAETAPLGDKSYKSLSDQIASQDAVDVIDAISGLGEIHLDRLRQLGGEQPWRYLATNAVRAQSMALLRKLMEQGLEPMEDDKKYGTSLCHMIASRGWIAGLQALGKTDAELVQLRDKRGRTLLHTAARYAQPDMVRYLLDMGVDMEVRDEANRTAFFKCVAGDMEGMGPSRGERWLETAFCLMDRGCSLTEHIGKTIRSATLVEYLANQGSDVLPLIATEQERRLQANTVPASGSSSKVRL